MPEPSPRRIISCPAGAHGGDRGLRGRAGGLGNRVCSGETGPRLPSHDPFYTYTGSRPLSEITAGTVLKKRAVTIEIAKPDRAVPAEQVLYRTTGESGPAGGHRDDDHRADGFAAGHQDRLLPEFLRRAGL